MWFKLKSLSCILAKKNKNPSATKTIRSASSDNNTTLLVRKKIRRQPILKTNDSILHHLNNHQAQCSSVYNTMEVITNNIQPEPRQPTPSWLLLNTTWLFPPTRPSALSSWTNLIASSNHRSNSSHLLQESVHQEGSKNHQKPIYTTANQKHYNPNW